MRIDQCAIGSCQMAGRVIVYMGYEGLRRDFLLVRDLICSFIGFCPFAVRYSHTKQAQSRKSLVAGVA